MLRGGGRSGRGHGPPPTPSRATASAAAGLAVLWAIAHARAAEPAAPPPSQPYEDQYLLAGDVPSYEIDVPIEPLGQRHFAAELVYYDGDHDAFGDEIEQGARASWQQETLNWGTLEAQAQFVDFDTSYLGRMSAGTDALVTLRQSAMPVGNAAMLDTSVGHQRTVVDSLLHGGYRYRLPTTLLLGASAELAKPQAHFRFATGEVGIHRGVALPRFEATGGKLTTAAYDRRINERFELGAELANLGDDDDVRDHTSLLLGGTFASPEGRHEHTARLLADNDGHVGFWTDSVTQLGANPVLRYGLFRFDAELAWLDVPIATDQMGFYLRADLSNYRYSVSTSYDYYETGIDATDLAPSQSHTVYLSSNLRLSRRLLLGFNGDASTRAYPNDEQFLWRGSAYVQVGLSLGDARVEMIGEELDSDMPGNRRDRDGFRVAFDWRIQQRVRLTTELRTEHYLELSGDVDRDELSVLFRYDLFDDVSLGLNTSLYRARGDAFGADDGVAMNADVHWSFHPSWNMTLSLNHNRAALDTYDPHLASYSDLGDRTIWATVRYSRFAGQPYPLFGRADGRSRAGTGALSGLVFYDKNRDSIRQPSEQVATGATLVLDGRYETRTDEQGRYSFAPVPAGAHEVTLLTEELPLPWGLDDERPQPITVWVRQTAMLDFPLVAMD
jgi:hypothetical protein